MKSYSSDILLIRISEWEWENHCWILLQLILRSSQVSRILETDQFLTSFLEIAADTIALGVVLGVAACGGPIIPYSAGRVDATGPSPVTVPQPQQDLATHTELFRRQGFNSTEMIALVSCGHTIGGVRQADFPQIFSGSQLAAFDSTLFSYDNTMYFFLSNTPLFVFLNIIISSVSEYLDGTTQDVLIVGPNVTTRSDFRIFSSDGNVTMQRSVFFAP